MAAFSYKIIKGAFGAAEHALPGLAGWIAFRLFARTADPEKLSAGERRANERAARLMAEARQHRLPTEKGWVMAYEFRPERYDTAAPVALIVHGWRSRTEHMTGIIRAVRDLGMRVISLDLPGHGKSSGRHITMMNAVEAVKLAETWFGPFDTLVGHSFGGAVVLNAAFGSVKQYEPVAVNRLVMVSAPNRMQRIFRWFGTTVGLGPKSQDAMENQVLRLTGNSIEVFSGDQQLKTMTLPTLIVHAPDDNQVEFAGAVAMAGAGDHVRLLRADGLGHSRIISDAKVLAQIAAFVNDSNRCMAA